MCTTAVTAHDWCLRYVCIYICMYVCCSWLWTFQTGQRILFSQKPCSLECPFLLVVRKVFWKLMNHLNFSAISGVFESWFHGLWNSMKMYRLRKIKPTVSMKSCEKFLVKRLLEGAPYIAYAALPPPASWWCPVLGTGILAQTQTLELFWIHRSASFPAVTLINASSSRRTMPYTQTQLHACMKADIHFTTHKHTHTHISIHT
jgi:hypothetical protein